MSVNGLVACAAIIVSSAGVIFGACKDPGAAGTSVIPNKSIRNNSPEITNTSFKGESRKLMTALCAA